MEYKVTQTKKQDCWIFNPHWLAQCQAHPVTVSAIAGFVLLFLFLLYLLSTVCVQHLSRLFCLIWTINPIREVLGGKLSHPGRWGESHSGRWLWNAGSHPPREVDKILCSVQGRWHLPTTRVGDLFRGAKKDFKVAIRIGRELLFCHFTWNIFSSGHNTKTEGGGKKWNGGGWRCEFLLSSSPGIYPSFPCKNFLFSSCNFPVWFEAIPYEMLVCDHVNSMW